MVFSNVKITLSFQKTNDEQKRAKFAFRNVLHTLISPSRYSQRKLAKSARPVSMMLVEYYFCCTRSIKFDEIILTTSTAVLSWRKDVMNGAFYGSLSDELFALEAELRNSQSRIAGVIICYRNVASTKLQIDLKRSTKV